MSDPQTAPKSPTARIMFGVATALVAAGLVSFQPTEFGAKLAILSSLTVTCALAPFMEQASRRLRRRHPLGPLREPSEFRTVLARIRAASREPAVIAAAIIALAAPIDTAALARNDQLILIEQGLSGDPNPQ